ncbi:UDP-N-acetylmuramoyl-L-alanyl-D-glutamate--2,6-diaminopimelate ligase [bacterium]|nr:UDP-N-acetylmuramoyl-L-alanyl-D-glutamate--2,6-diaminopimelate ligase [bacterium]
MIRISQLFGPVSAQISAGLRAQEITLGQVTSDSRLARPDSVFFAIRGTSHDGHAHVDGLLRSGILACVVEKDFEGADPRLIRVKDTREALGWAMSRLHGDPSHSMKMVGITGTSGKTTTSYLVESILQAAGHRVGVIGTVNFRIGSEIIPSTHTTPGSPELQALLSRMKASGCTAVVMEVSSHALKQHRTSGIAFDGVVFNNLSPEHLDFHPDMEDYFQSKKLLFTLYPQQSAHAQKSCSSAVNADDEYGARLISELADTPVIGFGMGGSAHASGASLQLGMGGIRGRIQWKDGTVVDVQSTLIARFNAYNILAAASVCRAMGVEPRFIAEGIAGLPGVPGRLEQVPNSLGATLLVDYAHKPDALEKVLKSVSR